MLELEMRRSMQKGRQKGVSVEIEKVSLVETEKTRIGAPHRERI